MSVYLRTGSMNTRVIPKSVSSELPQTCDISKEQFEFYSEHGYLVIKELIDFTSLYSYKKRFAQICNGVVERGNINIVKEPSLKNKSNNPEDYVNKISEIAHDEIFSTYVEHPRILHVVSQFIGDNITAVHDMLINKPPGSERHPSHQDLFYFPFRPLEKIIAAWTAIDHVDVDNGCLYVIPGSHKLNKLFPHAHIPGTKKLYHGIIDEDIVAPSEKRAQLEMAPGDTVFFHPLLIHGSGPNVSKNYRKAITCHYASSDCYYIDVTGTVQENVATEVVAEANRRGFENISYVDVWKYKHKLVKGVRSNL